MVKVALVGDLLITRSLPEKGYAGLDKLVELLSEHEVKFANLETTIHNNEGYPSAFPGGTWAMTNPACLTDIKYFGFNILNTANNHAMDYSHNGLLATIKHLNKKKLKYAGTGINLAAASAASFLECSESRIAVIGATSSFHDSDAAGNQRIDMIGRPGVNPLRHKSVYEVTQENYDSLKKISNEIEINDYHNQAIKEGYLLPKQNFNFANFEFIQGNENMLHTYPLETDLNRIVNSIIEAKKQADIVIVSIHSHQFSGGNKQNPAEFIKIFSKTCIDAGASIIVGHGPHLVRGIEVYKHGIIFYSLGNFIFQNETVTHLPADFYEKYSLNIDASVGSAMEKRSKNGTIGLSVDEDAWNSILVSLELDNNKMYIKLYPIDLEYNMPSYKKGWPKISNNEKILQKVAELSIQFNTLIKIEDNIGIIEI
jgi:poly-gamma-glutamate capsule biosynthesis protein CapA/YwtB (metallophosphatase superfamily)